jgi:acyl-CoA synthetase (AMP-forming)/AMP-acid ligase II
MLGYLLPPPSTRARTERGHTERAHTERHTESARVRESERESVRAHTHARQGGEKEQREREAITERGGGGGSERGRERERLADRRLEAGKWLYTGDWGFVDEEGMLYFVSRDSDRINTGGEKVSACSFKALF